MIDRNDDRHFLKIVKEQFTGLESPHYPDTPLVVDVGFRRSHPEPWLQLVDMVCGAVGSWIDGEDSSWHDRIASRRTDELSRA